MCYTDGLDAALEDLYTSEESELKWMYYGTAEGVLINYPGLLSPRGTGETGGLLDCSGDYDPRQRAWYVMGAAGPKDVILIIDKSGSMSKYGRMSNAKAAATLVVNSLTNIDFVSVVTFSTVAGSPNTMLVRAEAAYRAQMVSDIADINESGYTYYVKALTAAFDITNTSDTPGSAGYAYNSGCTRVYIFLTDGDPTDELAEFQTSLEAHLRSTDMFFFVALGDGIDAATTSDIQTIVCAVGGIYLAVADNDAAALDTAMASYYQYLALGAMVAEVQPTRWSEPYVSSPDIWGDVVSAVTPVFDKRDIGGVGAWTLIGVAAVDLPLCELVDAADAVGWDDDSTDDYASQTTKQGCSCERSYTYESVTYTSCTSYDWSSPWCAVEEGCGFELDAVSTTGHWDECDTSASVEGKVRLALRERSNVCYATELSSAALEALRGAYACASTSGGGSDDDEWESVLVTPNAFSCDDDGDAACAWEKSGYGDLQGDLCEGEYNTDACYECNSAMRPSCSYSECVAALAEFPPGDDDRGACANDEMGDDSVVGGGAIGLVIVVGVIVAVLVVGGVVGMLVMRMQKPAATTTTGSAARSPAAAVEMHAVQSTAPPVSHENERTNERTNERSSETKRDARRPADRAAGESASVSRRPTTFSAHQRHTTQPNARTKQPTRRDATRRDATRAVAARQRVARVRLPEIISLNHPNRPNRPDRTL